MLRISYFAAMAVLSVGAIGTAEASEPCVEQAGVLVCSGDQADGVSLSDPALPVVVIPAGPITSGGFVPGIWIESSGPGIAVSATADIVTDFAPGVGIEGVYAAGTDTELDYSGTIVSSNARAIAAVVTTTGPAVTAGSLSVMQTGSVQASSPGYEGVYALSEVIGAVNGGPVAATAAGGLVQVTTEKVQAGSTGVYARQTINAQDLVGTGGAFATGGETIVVSTGHVVVEGTSAAGVYGSTAVNAVSGGTAEAIGGTVTVRANSVSAEGTGATGVYATSVASASSTAGTALAQGGSIFVTTSGEIAALETNGFGIYARNIVAGNGVIVAGTVEIDVEAGSGVTGGAVGGAGVLVEGQTSAVIRNAGAISALSGRAIQASASEGTLIENAGTIVGRIVGGTIDVHNTGLWDLSGTSDLGTGGLLNEGTLAVAGAGNVGTAIIEGDFEQGAGGGLVFDVAWAGGMDLLVVTGSAELGGSVVVNALGAPPSVIGMTAQWQFVQTVGGVSDAGLEAVDTAYVDYEVVMDSFAAFLIARVIANDTCQVVSGRYECRGDLSAGVGFMDPAYAISVIPEGTITPSAGTAGVWVTGTGGGVYDVSVEGDVFTQDAYGVVIDLQTTTPEDVALRAAGNITSENSAGVLARVDVNGSGSQALGSMDVEIEGNVSVLGTGSGGVQATTSLTLTNTAGGALTGQGGLVGVTTGAVTVAGSGNGVIGQESLTITDVHGDTARALGGHVVVEATGTVEVGEGQGVVATTSIWAEGLGATEAVGGLVEVEAADVLVGGAFGTGVSVASYTASMSATGQGFAKGGEVVVTTTGRVIADGQDATGIFVWSESIGDVVEAGSIAITIVSGEVKGGAGLGAGVVLFGSADATIENAGKLWAESGWALGAYNTGQTVLNNSGLLIGSVEGTSIALNNTGRYEMGDVALLGAGNALKNEGTLAPGGTGMMQIAQVQGDLVLGTASILEIDGHWSSGESDQIVVTGAVVLDGKVAVNALDFPDQAGLERQFGILSAGTTLDDAGIEAVDTATVDYEVLVSGLDVFLTARINFLGIGLEDLDANQSAIGNAANAVLESGGSPAFDAVAGGLMTIGTGAGLAEALDQLSPQVYAYQAAETLEAAESFGRELLSCRKAGASAASIAAEGECLWALVKGRRTDLEGGANALGAHAGVWGMSGGTQVALSPRWRLGFAGGYESIDLQSGGFASGEGTRTQGGTALKYIDGPVSLTGTLSGGVGDYQTQRRFNFGGFTGMAEGRQDTGFVSGALEASYVETAGPAYIKPVLEGRITRLVASGLEESGGPGALGVGSVSETVVSVMPALEVGINQEIGAGAIRSYLRGGLRWRSAEGIDVGAEFAGVPGSFFVVGTGLDDLLGEVSAGLDVMSGDGAVLRLQGDGRFGERTQSYGASLKGSLSF